MKATALGFTGRFSQLVSYLKNPNKPTSPDMENKAYETVILKQLVQIGKKDSSFVNAHFDTKTIMDRHFRITKQEFYGCLFFHSMCGADFELISSGFVKTEAEMFANLRAVMEKRLASQQELAALAEESFSYLS